MSSTPPPPGVTYVRAEQARAHEIHQLGVAEASAILAKGEAEAKVCTPTYLSGLGVLLKTSVPGRTDPSSAVHALCSSFRFGGALAGALLSKRTVVFPYVF